MSALEAWLLAGTPARPSLARCFAWAWATSLGVATLTGAVLGLSYVPIAGRAWESVLALQSLPGGAFVRALHRSSAELSLVAGVLFVFVAALERLGDRAFRVVYWASAVGLCATALACITGNPLAHDNTGYFALSVETSLLGSLPLIGDAAQRALVGSGPEQDLLARLYARHSVWIPALSCAALGLAAVAARRSNLRARPPSAELSSGRSQLVRDLVASLGALIAIAIAAGLRGAPLGAPADASLSFPARPVWYLQPLFVLREAIPGRYVPVASLFASLGAVALLAAVPLLERVGKPSGASRRVRVAVAFGALAYAGLAVFGLVRDAKDPIVQAFRSREPWEVERVRVLARGAPLAAGALDLLESDPMHRARRLFAEHCANCHALGDLRPPTGELTAPKLDAFGRRQWVLALLDDPDAAELFGNSPFAGKMPSFTRPPSDPAMRATFQAMPEAERSAVAAFLEGQAFPSAVGAELRAEVTLGERIVKERCTSCHRYRGQGDDESEAPELAGWGSTEWLRAQILNPASGRTYRLPTPEKGHMPGYAGLLAPEEIELLVALIRGQIGAGSSPRGYQAGELGAPGEAASEG